MPPDYHPIETYCAYHEAGHAVAQIYYFGGGLKKVTLPRFDPERPDQYGAHSTLNFRDLPAPTNPVIGLRRVLSVLLAGIAAAQRWALDHSEEIGNPGDAEDRALAEGLVSKMPELGFQKDESLIRRVERSLGALFQRPKV